jgi:hypothetical protein
VRPGPREDALILYRIGHSIGRKDRNDLTALLDDFHANEEIQRLCRVATTNASHYLFFHRTEGQEPYYVAAIEIPPDTFLAVYSGFLEQLRSRRGQRHDMSLGRLDFAYPLCVDGTPGRGGDDSRPGQMQLVNHCCRPGNNAESVEIHCDVTGLTAFFLRSTSDRSIAPGEEIRFPYQEVVIKNGKKQYPQDGFWKKAASLPSPPRNQKWVVCNCAEPCPNGYGRLQYISPGR